MKRKKKDDSAENWSYKNDYPIEEVWNTDNYLAGVIAARLKAFKALDKHGYCPAFKGIAEWNKAIQKQPRHRRHVALAALNTIDL